MPATATRPDASASPDPSGEHANSWRRLADRLSARRRSVGPAYAALHRVEIGVELRLAREDLLGRQSLHDLEHLEHGWLGVDDRHFSAARLERLARSHDAPDARAADVLEPVQLEHEGSDVRRLEQRGELGVELGGGEAVETASQRNPAVRGSRASHIDV